MKYAIVTGGTKGIGKSITSRLLKEGYIVIATFLSDEAAANKFLKEKEINHRNNLHILKHDMSRIDNLENLDIRIKEITTTIDLIVFNAGATDRSSFEDMTLQGWKHVFDINLNVPIFLLQRLLSQFRENASVVFIGSIMGVYPHSTSLAYGVSKAAINSVVSNMVKFLVPYSVRINAIIPGFVETDWHNSKSKEIKDSIKSKIGLGYFCPPENIADFLVAIINNNYINGQCLQIDGAYNFR